MCAVLSLYNTVAGSFTFDGELRHQSRRVLDFRAILHGIRHRDRRNPNRITAPWLMAILETTSCYNAYVGTGGVQCLSSDREPSTTGEPRML
jgi:hypothetical protein